MRMRLIGSVLFLSVAAFGVVTWVALESREVAVLRTTKADGSMRTTRVWIAREEQSIWLEAATPERPWLRDVVIHPGLELELDGQLLRFESHPIPGAEGHEKIRALLREKYGWADVWVGLIQDTSRSVAVRIDPL